MNSLIPIVEAQSVPLADYFFICGLEPARLFDAGNGTTVNGGTAPGSAANGDKIDEDGPYDADPDQRPSSNNGTSEGGRRRARFSYEARKSMSSVLDLESQVPASNRSSTTIRAVAPENGPPMDEQGFMKALQTFATEREVFLGDINAATLFSAGQGPPPTRPRPKAKTQRIIGDEQRGVGTIRRRLSTMNPLSRQSTTSKRRKWIIRGPRDHTWPWGLYSPRVKWLTLYSLRPTVQTNQWLQCCHTQPPEIQAISS